MKQDGHPRQWAHGAPLADAFFIRKYSPSQPLGDAIIVSSYVLTRGMVNPNCDGNTRFRGGGMR